MDCNPSAYDGTDGKRPELVGAERPLFLFVLGMHRSGTSALTRVLNLLGATMASDLMEADPESNAKGFWESLEIVEINRELLWRLGRTWDDVRSTDIDKVRGDARRDLFDRAVAKLSSDFARSRLAVVKDPRLCRVVPWWLDVLEHCGWQARFVLPLRHPSEVAASLAARDGMGGRLGEALWLRYVLEAEAATRGHFRCFVPFEGLLEDWRSVLSTVEAQCRVTFPVEQEAGAEVIDQFLSSPLRRHLEGSASSEYGLLALQLHDSLLAGQDVAPELPRTFESLLAKDLGFVVEYQERLLATRQEVARRIAEIWDEKENTRQAGEWTQRLEADLAKLKQQETEAKAWVEEIRDSQERLRRELEEVGRWGSELEATLTTSIEDKARVIEWVVSLFEGALGTVATGADQERLTHLADLVAKQGSAADRADQLETELDETRLALVAAQKNGAVLETELDVLGDHARRLEAKMEAIGKIPLATLVWRSLRRLGLIHS